MQQIYNTTDFILNNVKTQKTQKCIQPQCPNT